MDLEECDLIERKVIVVVGGRCFVVVCAFFLIAILCRCVKKCGHVTLKFDI